MPRTQSANLALLQSCLLMAWRNLLSRPLLSLINIVGLALGLSCVLLITLFVSSETGYDTQWSNADRTWRVMRSFTPPRRVAAPLSGYQRAAGGATAAAGLSTVRTRRAPDG